MASGARILMYTQDSFGLGHLRRATNIANALVARRPELCVLMVVDSPVAPFFDLAPNIDFVKLPTVVKIGAGVFRTGCLGVGYEDVRVMRANLIKEIVQRFVPDVALVDHMPGGANRELVPALRMIRRRGLPTRMVLGLRDIIDRPEVTRQVWRREGVYRAMERDYQRVLVYGSREVFPTASEYRVDAVMGERVQYCGYVCNMDAVEEPARVREKLGLADEPIVVVMAGGGADAFELMKTYLESARLLGERRAFATLMVTGPFMPEHERKALRERARELGVQVKTSVGDSLSQINAADVVVSMCGYNTMSEILRFAKRAIVVPRKGPSAEQTMRARLFAQQGWVDVVEPDAFSAGSLAAALDVALSGASPRVRSPLALDGVLRASDALLAELPNGAAEPRAELRPELLTPTPPVFVEPAELPRSLLA
jgi:predicted glycosyltransferase